MSFFVCCVPVCPVRAEPSHRSEQVTQLLFGEQCLEVERVKDFVKIKVLHDQYEGWCQDSQLVLLADGEPAINNKALAAQWVNEVVFNNTIMHVPFGSPVPFTGLKDSYFGKNRVDYSGAVIEPANNIFSSEMVNLLALTFINTPYQWGGRSVFGIDCSGLTQMVYKCMNIFLQRDASQQVKQGDAIGFLNEARCGDLAFFDNEEGKITHTGILLNSGSIIHSSGKVRVDSIDSSGIVNGDTGKRTHKLRVIKRIVS